MKQAPLYSWFALQKPLGFPPLPKNGIGKKMPIPLDGSTRGVLQTRYFISQPSHQEARRSSASTANAPHSLTSQQRAAFTYFVALEDLLMR